MTLNENQNINKTKIPYKSEFREELNKICDKNIITIIGSSRYHMEDMEKRYNELAKDSIVVRPLNRYISDGMSEERLDKLYKGSIILSDIVVVENVNGYISKHTQRDIDFARQADIPVIYSYDIPSKKIPHIKPGSLLYNKKRNLYFLIIDSEIDKSDNHRMFLYARTSKKISNRDICDDFEIDPDIGMVIDEGVCILFKSIHNLYYDDGVIFSNIKPDNMLDWVFIKQIDDDMLNQFRQKDEAYHNNVIDGP